LHHLNLEIVTAAFFAMCALQQLFFKTFWARRKRKYFTGTILEYYLHNIFISQIGTTIHTLSFGQNFEPLFLQENLKSTL